MEGPVGSLCLYSLYMRILNIYKSTISDGPGLRYSIYLSGCRHACPGCHNPLSWDETAGVLLTPQALNDITEEINSDPLLDGITISGGDPFFNPTELTELLAELKAKTGKNIWCYTGYTIETILASESLRAPLRYIDTLVDGPFVQSLFSPELMWRGSSNQRIIPLQSGMPQGISFLL